MRGKLLFAAGLAAGYVIGARAGRPAYDAVVERVHGIRESGAVQQVGAKAKATLEERAPKVADVAEKAAETAAGAASAASDAGSDSSGTDSGGTDSGGTGSSGSGASGGEDTGSGSPKPGSSKRSGGSSGSPAAA